MPRGKKTTKTKIIACSQRRKKQMNDVPFLPEEIIINILCWLPADFLHNNARYVCKTWAHILGDRIFIKSPLLHSNSAIFVEDDIQPNFVHFLDTKEENLKMRYLNHRFPGLILGSSGGILLIYKSGNHARCESCGHRSLYAANPITMQVVKLPCPSTAHRFHYRCSNIAYIPHTGELKVVCPVIKSDESNDVYPYILTVGKDLSWRKYSNTYWRYGRSISAGGVVYWIYGLSWHSNHTILAMDLPDETTHYLQVPKELSVGAHWLHRMESNLCCMIWNQVQHGVLEIWILKDFHEKEWAIVNIILSANNVSGMCIGQPIAWLNNNQILFFKMERRVCSYNLKTGKWTITKNVNAYCREITVHINSLLSL